MKNPDERTAETVHQGASGGQSGNSQAWNPSDNGKRRPRKKPLQISVMPVVHPIQDAQKHRTKPKARVRRPSVNVRVGVGAASPCQPLKPRHKSQPLQIRATTNSGLPGKSRIAAGVRKRSNRGNLVLRRRRQLKYRSRLRIMLCVQRTRTSLSKTSVRAPMARRPEPATACSTTRVMPPLRSFGSRHQQLPVAGSIPDKTWSVPGRGCVFADCAAWGRLERHRSAQ